MRVIIRNEGSIYVGQVLEHDICAQGESVDHMMERLAFTVHLETAERGGSLDGIAPAPQEFHDMWAAAKRFEADDSGYELALAA